MSHRPASCRMPGPASRGSAYTAGSTELKAVCCAILASAFHVRVKLPNVTKPPSTASQHEHNHGRMKIIVMKFGGSSLANAGKIKHVAGRVIARKHDGYWPVVVVSAPGD